MVSDILEIGVKSSTTKQTTSSSDSSKKETPSLFDSLIKDAQKTPKDKTEIVTQKESIVKSESKKSTKVKEELEVNRNYNKILRNARDL